MFSTDEEIPIYPYVKLDPSPSDYCLEQDYEEFFEDIRTFLQPTATNILNLRKYAIVGGVYHLNLFYQPPQPQEYVTLDLNLAGFYLPKELKCVPYFEEYISPKPSELAMVFSRPSHSAFGQPSVMAFGQHSQTALLHSSQTAVQRASMTAIRRASQMAAERPSMTVTGRPSMLGRLSMAQIVDPLENLVQVNEIYIFYNIQ